MQENKKLIRVVLFGKSGIGKKSLSIRETSDNFLHQVPSVAGANFRYNDYLMQGCQVKAQFWNLDSSHEERRCVYFKSAYYKAHAVCFCFALDDTDSFQITTQRLRELKPMMQTCRIYLIGCKNDLPKNVSQQAIEAFVETEQIPYFSCSSKQNNGVNEVFRRIIEDSLTLFLKNAEQQNASGQTQSKSMPQSSSYCKLI